MYIPSRIRAVFLTMSRLVTDYTGMYESIQEKISPNTRLSTRTNIAYMQICVDNVISSPLLAREMID